MNTLDTIYVEDDEQEAFIMRIGMRRQGINILHVSDITLETITQLKQPPYDQAAAVIFDAILAGQSGVELADELRNSGDERPIFLLTAGENPDPTLLRERNIHYLRKPPHFENLAQMIRDMVGG
jgi:DNA-binding response OmpR family regulator